MTLFIAKYEGDCQRCFEKFQPGTLIRYSDNYILVHDICPELGILNIDNLPLCNKCFCYHVKECV